MRSDKAPNRARSPAGGRSRSVAASEAAAGGDAIEVVGEIGQVEHPLDGMAHGRIDQQKKALQDGDRQVHGHGGNTMGSPERSLMIRSHRPRGDRAAARTRG
jgi:hypothetical protein